MNRIKVEGQCPNCGSPSHIDFYPFDAEVCRGEFKIKTRTTDGIRTSTAETKRKKRLVKGMKRQEAANTCMYCGSKSLVYPLFCSDACRIQYHDRQRRIIRNMTQV